MIHGMPPGTIIQGSGQTLLQGHQTRMAPKSPHILVSQGIGEIAKPPNSWDDQKEVLALHLAPKWNGTFHEASQEQNEQALLNKPEEGALQITLYKLQYLNKYCTNSMQVMCCSNVQLYYK